MSVKQDAIKEILTSLKKAIGSGFEASNDVLETPPDRTMGDLAFPCFQLAKLQERNPIEIATEIAAKIGPTELIADVSSNGPYVNFSFNDVVLAERVLTEIKKEKNNYGNSKTGEGKKVLVEYAQPNTHKEFHVGHVRNALYGQAVVNLMKANGYETVAASYIGDVGAHVAKALWGMKKFHDGEEFPKEERARKLGAIYTEATKYIEEHEEAKEEVAEVQREIEAGNDPWFSLWKETRQWSLDAFKKNFAELGVKPDVWHFESEVEEPGKELVKKMLTDGIATKSQGATIVDLEDQNLGAFLVLKSDGSSLYATKDLALAFQKEEKFHPDRQIFVVDVRQSLYFEQLFATLKKMGFTKQLTHLSYDMVNLPEGTMSSRSGNVVLFEDLRNEMVEHLLTETKKRHEDWNEKQVAQVAHTVALSGLMFMMLRQDPKSIITFDIKEAMSFDGFTGPYILYTIARIESIKKKSKIKPKINAELLTHQTEKKLIRQLVEFPEVIREVGISFEVSDIAHWAFDTAKIFAEYYHEVRVIDEENKDMTAARLALIDSTQKVLIQAMHLLGIEVLEEM